jgi:hypothetical protein
MEDNSEYRQGRSKKQEDDSIKIVGVSIVILVVVLGILLMVSNF